MRGCRRSYSFRKPPPEVSFTGLKNQYCNNDEDEVLIGSPTGGTFGGNFILDLEMNEGLVRPSRARSSSENLIANYTFIDEFGCSNSSEQTYTIFLAPIPQLPNLEEKNCQNGSIDTINLNYPGGTIISTNGKVEIIDDSPEDSLILLNKISQGLDTLVYTVMDANGCVNSTHQIISINPIPALELTEDTIYIIQGERVTIGQPNTDDNYEYLWSTEQRTPNIDVRNPAVYILLVTDTRSGCMNSDTILLNWRVTAQIRLNNWI